MTLLLRENEVIFVGFALWFLLDRLPSTSGNGSGRQSDPFQHLCVDLDLFLLDQMKQSTFRRSVAGMVTLFGGRNPVFIFCLSALRLTSSYVRVYTFRFSFSQVQFVCGPFS